MKVTELRKIVNAKRVDQFKLQSAVKFLAENIEMMPMGAVQAFKDLLRKGAINAGIELQDLQDVYNSYRK